MERCLRSFGNLLNLKSASTNLILSFQVETGELVLGKAPVGLLMEAACISTVATCTVLADHEVTSIMAAVTQGCREAPARVCMELQKALMGQPEQQRQSLKKMAINYLGSSRLSLLRDPKLSKSCSELQSEFPNSIGITANMALAKAISENAGSFVLEHGVLAFTNTCDELRQASGHTAHYVQVLYMYTTV